MLIASGMNTDVQDMDGLTPADLADECDHEDCALFLRNPSQVRTTPAMRIVESGN